MVWEMGRYIALDRVAYLWADPPFHFKYLGFGWVEALGGNGMHIVCWGMLVAAAGITIGLVHRWDIGRVVLRGAGAVVLVAGLFFLWGALL